MDLKHPLYIVPSISTIQEMIIMSGSSFAGKLAMEDLSQTPVQSLILTSCSIKCSVLALLLKISDCRKEPT